MGRSDGHTEAQGFPYEEYDSLDVPLGDILRGERATAGKSLLDVERDLKIKATYIAAIENSDLDAFASRGFIAGYVRSYARYLGLDPEWTYSRFARESGFTGVHGFSAQQAAAARRSFGEAPRRVDPNDVIVASRVSFAPAREKLFDRIEPGALGSIAVLAAVVLGIGYGAWAILHDIQRLQFAPVDEAPSTYAEFDPVPAGPGFGPPDIAAVTPGTPGARDDGFDPIYRPQALDVPVLTPRDEPIAALDPDRVGTLVAPETVAPVVEEAAATEVAEALDDEADVQVTATSENEVTLVALCPSWIRIRTPSGTVVFEGTLDGGETFALSAAEEPPVLRTGNAGGIYFMVDGQPMGPAGESGAITDNVALSAEAIAQNYGPMDRNLSPETVQFVELAMAGEDIAPVLCQ
ncbi:DUF4115 domain-containing protein [Rhodobacterales bacterium HKCCE3408]|nr:DUF4115 domain-containing protein [Rhodobacterales bacterium HKCCE3408]